MESQKHRLGKITWWRKRKPILILNWWRDEYNCPCPNCGHANHYWSNGMDIWCDNCREVVGREYPFPPLKNKTLKEDIEEAQRKVKQETQNANRYQGMSKPGKRANEYLRLLGS